MQRFPRTGTATQAVDFMAELWLLQAVLFAAGTKLQYKSTWEHILYQPLTSQGKDKHD